MASPFGFLNALKPPGLTSTAFGTWVRRAYGGAPIGHWGTLDPAACGVLVLAVGNATRLLPLLAPSTKRYSFELVLGASTDTGDATGVVTMTGPVPAGWRERLPQVAAGLIGPLEQVPPMYSAVKVEGRPLYVRARKGERVARTARHVRVLALDVVAAFERGARMVVECESGLYVRSLCEEIGARLGAPAHMGALVRTAAGPFCVDASRLPDEIAAQPLDCLLDPLDVLALPRVALDQAATQRFVHGNRVQLDERDHASTAHPRAILVLHGNRLIGVGSLRDGRLEPRRVFNDDANHP
ncbi:MAG: tRNA pseudouridine(55) synthase TruB [Candidatus Eremiobacteraeota bacterium]|nr:tRNA pseudouridine(55) synthase TruB [Candidatus Eremiobacteraeota bacterium]